MDGHRPCVINRFTRATLMADSARDTASILPSPRKNQELRNEASRGLQTWAPQMKGWLPPLPGPSCARLAIMLVLVLIFLPSMYCDLGSVYHSSYEIVIPQSLAVEGREDPEEEVSYTLPMQGQKQLLHLKVKRDYFVHNFPVFSYRNGILGQAVPFISRDCHYEGYVEGVPGSFVSVNICSGLRGFLVKEEQSYGIEPMHSSKRFEHVLYTMAHEARVSCSVTSNDSQVAPASQQQDSSKPRSLQAPSYLWSHTKYVEMFVVVNHQRFQMWGSDANETVQRVMDIIALANSFTRGINTEVVLAGMEIWTEGDLAEVPVDLRVALRNFNSWRQEKLVHRVKHDVAHMIVGHRPKEDMGQAFLNGACSSDFAAAVESFHHEDVLLFAALMVHQLGHNLGMQHDHSACVCKDAHFCLMLENITKESGFSNCSFDFFHQFLWEHKGACLFNKPGHKRRLRRNGRCGNGVVEDDEQCDCGSDCDIHPCCDQTCRLKQNAECSDGLCCDKCRLRYKGFPCRPALGECDLPEYCDGSSGECPPDSYKQDGTMCERIHYCARGRCKNPDNQCMDIFGFPARSAPENCYISMNRRGDRFGNCGITTLPRLSYVKCVDDHIFCGKLVCTNVKQLPQIKPNQTLIQVPHNDDFCWSMDVNNIPDVPDDGAVQAGTLCVPHKACVNYSCSDYAVFIYDCKEAEMCNGKGVCNNFRHCHCEAGYAPPDCRYPGNGGSVDSGSPSKPSNGNINDNNPSEEDSRSHIVAGSNSGRYSENKVENQSLDKILYIFPLFLLAMFLALIISVSVGARKEMSQCSQEALEETEEEAIQGEEASRKEEEKEAENE